jgi:hypothetical protein
VDVSDRDLVIQLESRDGRRLRMSHTAAGACRYAEMYGDGTCPWCAAERRRQAAVVAADTQVRPLG